MRTHYTQQLYVEDGQPGQQLNWKTPIIHTCRSPNLETTSAAYVVDANAHTNLIKHLHRDC